MSRGSDRESIHTKKIADAASLAPLTGPLCAANRGFHDSYNRLIAASIAQLGETIPVAVMIGDHDFLLIACEIHTVQVLPDQYHHLKAVSHSAFGLQLWLMANLERTLDDSRMLQLLAMQQRFQDSLSSATTLPDEEQPPAELLLNSALASIDESLRQSRIDGAQARDFAAGIAPLVTKLASGAVRLELAPTRFKRCD